MKKFLLIITFLATILFTVSSYADEGQVIYTKVGCSYYVVETLMGFSILEWYGGHIPLRGDIITGKLNLYGIHKVRYNHNSEGQVYINDTMLSRSDANSKFFEKCPVF